MTILDRLLHEISVARGPISSTLLAQRLDVPTSALEGMLSVLTRQGRLVGDDSGAEAGVMACSGAACGTSCAGLDTCAFIASVPRSHRLVVQHAPR